MRAFMQSVSHPDQFLNAGDYADIDQVTLPAGFVWVEGEPPVGTKPYIALDPLTLVEQGITQGQALMSANPLPLDLQKQIFDLELFIQNYYKRGAIGLILESLQGFVIPDDRIDVSSEQRAIIAQLKAQMLAVFNAL